MLPYYILFAAVSFGLYIPFLPEAALRKETQAVYFMGILPILAVFAGFRAPVVDRDYENYQVWFHAIANHSASLAELTRDPAFALISWLVSVAGLHYSMVAFIYGAIGLAGLWYLARFLIPSRWVILYFFLLFCQLFAVWDMTEIREGAAVPLMAISLYYACERQRRRSILLFLLALVFHFSAIIVAPLLLLLLLGIEFRSRIWIVALIVSALIASYWLKVVVSAISGLYRVSEYLNGGEERGGLTLMSFYVMAHVVVIGGVALFLWKKVSIHGRIATLCGIVGILIFMIFIHNTGLATRCLFIFDLYWLFLVILMLDKCEAYMQACYTMLLFVFGLLLYHKSLEYIRPYSLLSLLR